MKENWKIITLGELSCGNKGYYGIGASAVEYSTDKYTYLRISDINDDGTINRSDLKSVDEPDAHKYILKPNDIVFARTGNSTGRNYFYDEADGVLVYAGFLIKFSIDANKVNPKYIKYYVQSDIYKNWVKSFDTGGTRGNINAQTFSQFQIKIPIRKQQDFLVNILSSIDEKIKVNNQINDNLEEQAQALYKESFFEGNKMDFIELGDVIETTSGGTPSRSNPSFYKDGTVCWVKSKELKGSFIIETEESITLDAINNSSAKILPQNSVLIAMYGATVGDYGIIYKPMTCNQAICALIPNEKYPSSFLFMLAKNKKEELVNLAIGSAQQNISQFLIRRLLVPSNTEVIRKYNESANPLFKLIERNEKENLSLSHLRDSLLPKLMSGEISVEEIEF